MEIKEIIEDPKKVETLRVIEKPANISSPLEISIETGLNIDDVKKTLKELENASLVRQKSGYYGITHRGMKKMRNMRKNELI